MKYAQFKTLTKYNTVNLAIIAYKDILSNGAYTRSNTIYAYTPTPEPNWDGKFYMPADEDLIEAGLFKYITLVDEIPVEVKDEEIVNPI